MQAVVTGEARKQANLRLLQRTCDASITEIHQTATHVVLYEYKDTAWHKSGMEGSLFLCQSSTSGYQLVILNRNSVDNFQMPVTQQLQLQHQEPYLIFKEQTQSESLTRIRGIWFHSADERMAVAQVIQETIQRLRSQTPPTAVDPSAALSALLSPMSVHSSNSSSPENSNSQGIALDKKSLQLALLSLIQDDRFLDLIHSQYLRVVHARAKKQSPNNNNNNNNNNK